MSVFFIKQSIEKHDSLMLQQVFNCFRSKFSCRKLALLSFEIPSKQLQAYTSMYICRYILTYRPTVLAGDSAT